MYKGIEKYGLVFVGSRLVRLLEKGGTTKQVVGVNFQQHQKFSRTHERKELMNTQYMT